MFTGIITYIGKLEKKEKQVFTFSAPADLVKRVQKGTSIAVNGCCLTVIGISGNTFSFEVMPETQKKTMLGSLKTEQIVNLELPVSVATLLSGHIVQGHVDGVGSIQKIDQKGISQILTISVPQELIRYIAVKGSITVNGISLTVVEVNNAGFTVGIIPRTWEHTMLHAVKIDDKVNIEVDILAKYIEKLTTT